MKNILLMVAICLPFYAFGQGSKEPKNIAIFLQDNVELLDFAGPMEVFLVAGYNVYTVAESTKPMKSMHALTIVPDYSIEHAPIPDIVVFVGGGDLAAAKKEKVKAWVKKVVPQTTIKLSVCTGAFFLAETGFLDNKIATTYHKSTDYLQSQFPKIDVRDNVRFVDNGRLITTAGISAGIDGAFHLVSKLKGKRFAQKVAQDMEYDKWIPEEGLILPNNTLLNIQLNGFQNFLSKPQRTAVYLGEILNLTEELSQNGAYAEAEKGIQYALDNMKSPTVESYQYLRENYLHQGKKVPITNAEFLKVIKKEGVQKAEQIYQANKKAFPSWVFLNSEAIIEMAYLDYYAKGKLKEAMDIQALNKRMFPNDAYVTYVLGLYYERSDDLESAIRYYREALQLDPQFAMAQDKINQLKKSGKL